MARAGITYAEVEQAAAVLAAEGKNPTVDAVRAALGGTGSKSTLAPLLKSWKSARQEQAQVQQAGLPAQLLDVVKGLHMHLQQDAQQQVRAAQVAAEAVVAECRQQVEAADAATAELAGKRAALESDLTQEKARRAQLETAQHALQLACATAQEQGAGLLQRLTDRQSEIDNLNRQLAQSRTQFEHYQEAAAAQRASEREEAQQRCNRLEQEVGELRRNLAGQQKALAQRETQLEQSGARNARLETDLTALRQTHQAAMAERQQLGQEIAAQSLLCAELRAQLKAVSQAMGAAGAELAVLRHQAPQLQARLLEQENRAAALQLENHLLMQDKARLEGRLVQISQA
ncbi:DNA-binding protein [Herminiimonas sp. CN]|uniref:DNA-binding protein n=1 Tax=Herminiimonas sp. CN TaxID=1349818 RepID=UPI000473F14C|nr:DNA-binding protein [Herminiimonas sp. CN]